MTARKVVIKSQAYTLAHAPDLLLHYGATQRVNPNPEHLKKLTRSLRSYEDVLGYYPYQVYIGNLTPDELKKVERPWYKQVFKEGKKYGKYGVILSEPELYGLMKVVDVFDLVHIKDEFARMVKNRLMEDPVLTKYPLPFDKLDEGKDEEEIKRMASKEETAPLYLGEEIVGCVREASKEDENQSAHLMLELIANKATAVLSVAYGLDRGNIRSEDIDFVIECSEDIGGDIYNRGGGGIGKSVAEFLGCKNATGFDLKSFCSAPVFALLQAWALVASGLYDNVAVLAGGSVAKLGMNAKTHVKKDMPALEDVLGGLTIILSEDDEINPVIWPMGKQDVKGSYHIAGMLQSLIFEPLRKRKLLVTDVDWFAPELQIPEILGRDIPLANYRYIAEAAVRQGLIKEEEREEFIDKHGVPGFAPQQGHIPSGVPLLGHARDAILARKISRAMIIGKGSLFLSRITKLHDGVSMIIEAQEEAKTT
ncbi:MAG: hypothetical protein AOA65_0941 [Candidatus Bathyarchaeota archaeon BA1]|nr:MAG: hypothetical protein AOA65_0941 [Candidatus Bathyarchaeota archaeon BA1]